jgi:hypothetical protein
MEQEAERVFAENPDMQPAGKCPACGRVYTVSDVEWEGERSPYLPCHPIRWQNLIALEAELDPSLQEDQGAGIARTIAASIDQAEAEGRAGYSVCMRCGALFDGEYCPTCDERREQHG